ncbi:hypothetical protein ELQ90_15240 [Labedella phragmitis]|uniref:SAF domain-containing protein n=1 Tax=Labedella phragmitis TaxID=2498849 RepID=A0A444PPR1_9MICO|nr:hypothetical protein [Labedella phragmitis]RWZ46401.1 hypothetical protein ELQ90_15240 [Labedella phragmitis]
MSARPPKRRRFPRSVDVRLLVGIVLVAASIGGVWAVVAAADRSVPVYAAASTIVAGDAVGKDDFVVEQVSLGRAGDLYAAPGSLGDGLVATRTVLAGELMPREALSSSHDLARAPVVVTVAGELAERVTEGREVDVWTSSTGDGDEAVGAPPSVLVSGALVMRIVKEESLVAGSSEVSVELSVPDGAVAVLLAATAAGDSLTLVPVDGGTE